VLTVRELSALIERSPVVTRSYLKCLRISPQAYTRKEGTGGKIPLYPESTVKALTDFKDVPNKQALLEEIDMESEYGY
jgi:hypothetical protein